MANDKNQQSSVENESNAERDQDEGSMNNGTIGGNMGDSGSNEHGSKVSDAGATTSSESTGSGGG